MPRDDPVVLHEHQVPELNDSAQAAAGTGATVKLSAGAVGTILTHLPENVTLT